MSVRTLLTAVAAATALSPASASAGEALHYYCVLSGLQVTPSMIDSPAIGGGRLTIDTDANTVTYRIAFNGLPTPETLAHIHGFADPGEGADVLHDLGIGNPKVGVWTYDEAQEAGILAGRTYVNIHSTEHTGGEIRGQVVPLNASLTGEQAGIATTAEGFGVFTIDTAANQLGYYVAFTGLSSPESGAHIHGAALHGSGAGVIFNLGTGSPKAGTWSYPENREADILAGRTYVNIHSNTNTDGEIRGQIVPTVVPLDGAQVPKPTGSTAAGVGLFAMSHDDDALSYDIRHQGILSGETNAHIHGFAPEGMGAGVIHTLPSGSPKIGVFAYPPGDEQSLLDALAYVNIHSTANGGGEIRGQIIGLPCPPAPLAVGDPAFVPGLHPAAAPNPFGPFTTIRFELERIGSVRLTIFDAAGRFVRTLLEEPLGRGAHEVVWDALDGAGRHAPNGVYHYVLVTPGGSAGGRVTLVR